jgi:transposase
MNDPDSLPDDVDALKALVLVERAAAIYTLIETAKLNAVDPRAWLADVLARLHDHPAKRITELLPWNWGNSTIDAVAA